MPASSRFEKRSTRPVNAEERQGNLKQPIEFGNPAWQSNSKVGSRARVELGKAQYTWRAGKKAGLNHQQIEPQPIVGWRGQFNRNNISSIIAGPDGREDQAIIKQRKPREKQRYKSSLASNSAKTKNNWIIYVRLARIFYNTVAKTTQVAELKYPQLISDPILQAMFHAKDADGFDCPLPPDHYILFSDPTARYNFDVFYKMIPVDNNQIKIENPFDIGNPRGPDGTNYREYIHNQWDQIQNNAQFRALLPPTAGLHYWPFRYTDNSNGLDNCRYGVDYETWINRYKPFRLIQSQRSPDNGTPVVVSPTSVGQLIDLVQGLGPDDFWEAAKENAEIDDQMKGFDDMAFGLSPINDVKYGLSPINDVKALSSPSEIQEIAIPYTPSAEVAKKRRRSNSADQWTEKNNKIQEEIESLLQEVIMGTTESDIQQMAIDYSNDLLGVQSLEPPSKKYEILKQIKEHMTRTFTSFLKVDTSQPTIKPVARVLFPPESETSSSTEFSTTTPSKKSSIKKTYFEKYREQISTTLNAEGRQIINSLIKDWNRMSDTEKKATITAINDLPLRYKHAAREMARNQPIPIQTDIRFYYQQMYKPGDFSRNSDTGFAPGFIIREYRDLVKQKSLESVKALGLIIAALAAYNDHYALFIIYNDLLMLPTNLQDKFQEIILYLENGNFDSLPPIGEAGKVQEEFFRDEIRRDTEKKKQKLSTPSRTASKKEIDEAFNDLTTPSPQIISKNKNTVYRNAIDKLLASPTSSPYQPVSSGVDENLIWESPSSQKNTSPLVSPIAFAPGRMKTPTPKQKRSKKAPKKFSPSDFI